jgi:nucleotidyltransferase/DNA polymerase involved in DNA repair
MPRVILYVDMDAFFASIQQRDHPEDLLLRRLN